VGHNLNHKHPLVQIYTKSDYEQKYPSSIIAIDEDNLAIVFPVAEPRVVHVADWDWEHEQSAAATIWTITHTLDAFAVMVMFYDSDDKVIMPASVKLVSETQVIATFDTAVAGYAVLKKIATGAQNIEDNIEDLLYAKIGTGTSSTSGGVWDPVAENDLETPVFTSYDITTTSDAAHYYVKVDFEYNVDVDITEIGLFDHDDNILFYSYCNVIHKPADILFRAWYQIPKSLSPETLRGMAAHFSMDVGSDGLLYVSYQSLSTYTELTDSGTSLIILPLTIDLASLGTAHGTHETILTTPVTIDGVNINKALDNSLRGTLRQEGTYSALVSRVYDINENEYLVCGVLNGETEYWHIIHSTTKPWGYAPNEHGILMEITEDGNMCVIFRLVENGDLSTSSRLLCVRSYDYGATWSDETAINTSVAQWTGIDMCKSVVPAVPSASRSKSPSRSPSLSPSESPSRSPSLSPSESPSVSPSPTLYELAAEAIVSDIYSIVGEDNVRALWIFDSTGSTQTVNDRSGHGHTITLRNSSQAAASASAFSPGFEGLAPYLSCGGAAGSAGWNTPHHSDFSFQEPQVFSIVSLMSFNSLSAVHATTIFNKGYNTSDSEYMFLVDPSKRLCHANYNNGSLSTYIGRHSTATMTSQIGSWHTYAMSYSGSAASAGVKLYNDGAQVDTANFATGSYASMASGDELPASYYLLSGNPYSQATAKYSLLLVCSCELSLEQNQQLDTLLKEYVTEASSLSPSLSPSESPSTAILYSDDCSSLTGWTDTSTDTGSVTQTTFDGKSCFCFQVGATSTSIACIHRHIAGYDWATTGAFSLEVEYYFDLIGSGSSGTFVQLLYAEEIGYATDGMFVGATEIGTDIIAQDTWQKIKAVFSAVHVEGLENVRDVTVYLNDILQGTATAIVYGASDLLGWRHSNISNGVVYINSVTITEP